MKVIEITRGHPWKTKKEIAEETGRSTRTVENKMKGMRREIEAGRYSPYVLPTDQGLINLYAYIDYITFEKMLNDKNLRKAVPPFDPTEIERIAGYRQRVINLE